MEMLICGQPPSDLPYRAATNLGVDLRPGWQSGARRPAPGSARPGLGRWWRGCGSAEATSEMDGDPAVCW